MGDPRTMGSRSTNEGGISRRGFLSGAASAVGSLALGGPLGGCAEHVEPYVEPTDWRAGRVAHLLPTASHDRLLVKASFHEPLEDPPLLRVSGRAVTGVRRDSRGRFFSFDVAGLAPDTAHTLELVDAAGAPLCDPWPLRTFPAPDALPERFRLLAYTCAGGPDIIVHPTRGPVFQPLPIRQRLLARGLSFAPDAVLANGDHVYWDLHSSKTFAMGRLPQAWWHAGYFDREAAILGTRNEVVLEKAFGPQIAGLYGTLFRSVPVFFLQDDHDYTENDEATDERRTFPADAFMREAARVTQSLYYPELLASRRVPPPLVSPSGVCESFGELRYGRLFEGLLYDCRRDLANAKDLATAARASWFVPPAAERWVRERVTTSDALHVAQVPSTPVLWTAGKWGEWYPDVQDDDGRLSIDSEKPGGPKGWLAQHQRLVAAASARRDRTPLFLMGDLHSTGAGRMLGSDGLDLSANPIVALLTGTPGTRGLGWPSQFRGQRARPSLLVEAEEWIEPIEENGFTLLDVTPDAVSVRMFRWTSDQPIEAIASLEPFAQFELPRPA